MTNQSFGAEQNADAVQPPEGLTEAVDAFLAELLKHVDHPKQQVGPCVYCIPCDVRLYQGQDPNARPDPREEPDPEDWIGWVPTTDEDLIPTECPVCHAYGACGYDAEGRALIHSLNDDEAAESAVEEVVNGA